LLDHKKARGALLKERSNISAMKNLLGLALIVMSCLGASSAQLMNVKIVQRQSSDTQYTYQVAGHSNTYVSATSNSAFASTSTTAPQMVTYSVTGATFSLLLPDGRVAIVNCESKFHERFAGPSGNKRSCRMPLVDNIQVEFKGKNAKLIWPVSIDGKKMETETYSILAVLDK
jgi:hypothetical protein